jgi:hypothetical protein
LAGIVIVSSVVRFALARHVVAPWIVADEIIHSDLAKSFATSGHFLIRGEDVGASFGVVYQVLISFAYRLFASVPDVYLAIKAINAVTMSLAAVPAYLLARRVLSHGLSLIAAALTVAVPSMVYTGMVMTESAFYPLFLCTTLVLFLYLESPSVLRALLLVALSALAFATRTEAICLLPTMLSAPLVLIWLDGSGWRALRKYQHVYWLVGGIIVLTLAVEIGFGSSPFAAFGAYQASARSHSSIGSIPRWFLYHLAELDLYVGVFPFAAFLVLLTVARRLSTPRRIFLAVVAPLMFWLLLEVAGVARLPAFDRIEERYTFYLAPLLLIASLVWIAQGAPRPVLATGLAATLAALLPAFIPVERLVNGPGVVSDTLALVPWWTLHDSLAVGFGQIQIMILVAALAIVSIFVFIPTRLALVLPALVLVSFAVVQWQIDGGPHGTGAISTAALAAGTGGEESDWIDRTVGTDAQVTVVWTGKTSLYTVWENEFFNRSVGVVYNLATPPFGAMPAPMASFDSSGLMRDEEGLPVYASYVLTDTSLQLRGKQVAADPTTHMVLYGVEGPVQST